MLFAGELEFAGQSLHAELSVAADVPDHFPLPQDKHILVPDVEYSPGSQSSQVSALVLPSPSEALPDAQDVHCEAAF